MLKLVQTIKDLVKPETGLDIASHDELFSSQTEFHRALNLERERSDRSGLSFSVLVFAVKDTEDFQPDIQLMKEYLSKRLRATDSFGRLDHEHIGITLFNTTSKGAKVLARDIHGYYLSAQKNPPETKVFVYPDEAPKITSYSRDFHRTIKLERERSDRSGLPFSILIFELSKAEEYEEDVNLIKKFLSNRLRATDSIGWIDENNIAVTMFNTLPEGANVLVDDIHNIFISSSRKPPEIKLLNYRDGVLKYVTNDQNSGSVEQIDFSADIHSTGD
jgi:hypothetical protein